MKVKKPCLVSANCYSDNMAALRGSEFQWRFRSSNLVIFREIGKPKADFFPKSGEWINLETGERYHGGGLAFLTWYRVQESKI